MLLMMENQFYNVLRIIKNAIENIIGRYHSWGLKFSKTEIKSAENSSFLHTDSFKINTLKSQVNESVLVAQLWENFIL